MYFRARYYSGELGRFVSRDPYQALDELPWLGASSLTYSGVGIPFYYDYDVYGLNSLDYSQLAGVNYYSGLNLYAGYFVPVYVDPEGYCPKGPLVNHMTRGAGGAGGLYRGGGIRLTKHTINRHVTRSKYPEKSKYKKPSQTNKLIEKTIKKPDSKKVQNDGRVVYEKNMKREIGTKGETTHKVVVDPKRNKVVTAYPKSGTWGPLPY
jgi:hypothetical protein